MDDKVNVLLITIDCLRVDHLSCFGYHKNISPELDSLAKEGVMFTQAITNGPSTPASFPSILSSTYPLMYNDYPKISERRTLISEILKEHGYKTAGFNSNPYLSKYSNYNKGFDFFEDYLSRKSEDISFRKKILNKLREYDSLYAIMKKINNIKKKIDIENKNSPLNLPYQRADRVNADSLAWLEQNQDGFFLWLHYMDTHHPFYPPKEFSKFNIKQMEEAEKYLIENPDVLDEKILNNLISLYDETIQYVDYCLGKLFLELKNKNLWDSTLIIITADHGEEFKEHGDFSHIAKLYDELIHVPLIIKGSQIQSNISIDNIVSLIDLAPTILDYLHLPPCKKFVGESLLPLILNDNGPYSKKWVISETLRSNGKVSLSIKEGKGIISIRTEGWKYIINEDTKERELYDLNKDPKETINLYTVETERCREYENLIQKHILMEEKAREKDPEMEKINESIKKLKVAEKI